MPESLHQFINHFQIKWFRRLTLPNGLWFPCCGVCFRCTRWPSAFPGTLQIQRYAQLTALCLARHTQTMEAGSGDSGPPASNRGQGGGRRTDGGEATPKPKKRQSVLQHTLLFKMGSSKPTLCQKVSRTDAEITQFCSPVFGSKFCRNRCTNS